MPFTMKHLFGEKGSPKLSLSYKFYLKKQQSSNVDQIMNEQLTRKSHKESAKILNQIPFEILLI